MNTTDLRYAELLDKSISLNQKYICEFLLVFLWRRPLENQLFDPRPDHRFFCEKLKNKFDCQLLPMQITCYTSRG